LQAIFFFVTVHALFHAMKTRLKGIYKKSSFKVICGVCLGFLLLLNLIMIFQWWQLRAVLSGPNGDGQILSQLTKSQNYLTMFGSDLNEIREFLLLPTHDYNFNEDSEIPETTELDEGATLYQWLQKIGELQAAEKTFAFNKDLVQQSFAKRDWTRLGLVLEENSLDEEVSWKFKGATSPGLELVNLNLSLSGFSGACLLDGAGPRNDGMSLGDGEAFLKWFNALLDNPVYQKNLEQAQKSYLQVQEALASPAFQELLQSRALQIEAESDCSLGYFSNLIRDEHGPVLRIVFERIFDKPAVLKLQLMRRMEGAEDKNLLDGAGLVETVIEIFGKDIDWRSPQVIESEEKINLLKAVIE
jgi:hypothetical protein